VSNAKRQRVVLVSVNCAAVWCEWTRNIFRNEEYVAEIATKKKKNLKPQRLKLDRRKNVN
jgi:hypothetical protein